MALLELHQDRAQLKELCDSGHGDACTSYGNVLRGNNFHDPEATGWFLRGCDLGDGDGCQRYAFIQETNKNRDLAAEGWVKGCKLGRPMCCHRVGVILFQDPAQRAAAADLFEDNCVHGFDASCTAGAIARAPLLGPQADCKRAVPLAERTCRSRNADACAVVDACKLAVDGERAAAVERLRTACDRKVQIACLYWADAQPPASAQTEQMHKAYVTACKVKGEVVGLVACPRLAGLELMLAGSEAAAQRHLDFLNRACAASVGEACCVLADVHKSGKWSPSDRAQVADLRSKACILGQTRCCAPTGR